MRNAAYAAAELVALALFLANLVIWLAIVTGKF
jgi:hypothetical protein